MEILSKWTVTDFKTKEVYDELIEGTGEEAIGYLRKQYPKFSKFVLEGFEITTLEDGEAKTVRKKLNLGTYNNVR